MNQFIIFLIASIHLHSFAMDVTIKTSKASFEETKTAYTTLYGERQGTIQFAKHLDNPFCASAELTQMLNDLQGQRPQNSVKIAACELLLQIYGEDNDENSYQEGDED